jgi:hypothetical protein
MSEPDQSQQTDDLTGNCGGIAIPFAVGWSLFHSLRAILSVGPGI